MTVLIAVLIVTFALFVPGNLAGWAVSRRPGDAFNWRIFLGPFVYYEWADEQRYLRLARPR